MEYMYFYDLVNSMHLHYLYDCHDPNFENYDLPLPTEGGGVRTTTSSTRNPQALGAVFTPDRGGRTGMSTSGVSFLGSV